MKKTKKRALKFVMLGRLNEQIANTHPLGDPLAPDDIRRAGNSLPDIPLPKVLPKYEKPSS